MSHTELHAAPIAGLQLREFAESDEAEVTSWFADAGELRFFAGRRLRWPLDSGQWRSIRLDPSVTAWTAVIGDDPTPIGHAEMVRESAEVVRLARLAIAPVLRGHGLGRVLVYQLIARSRDAGFSVARIAAHPDNSNAIRAYRGLGFVPADGAADEAAAVATRTGSHAGELLLELRLDGLIGGSVDAPAGGPIDGGS